MAERDRLERSPHGRAAVFKAVWGANPSTFPSGAVGETGARSDSNAHWTGSRPTSLPCWDTRWCDSSASNRDRTRFKRAASTIEREPLVAVARRGAEPRQRASKVRGPPLGDTGLGRCLGVEPRLALSQSAVLPLNEHRRWSAAGESNAGSSGLQPEPSPSGTRREIARAESVELPQTGFGDPPAGRCSPTFKWLPRTDSNRRTFG
jgi:hypothetical protein